MLYTLTKRGVVDNTNTKEMIHTMYSLVSELHATHEQMEDFFTQDNEFFAQTIHTDNVRILSQLQQLCEHVRTQLISAS
jgi:hypothetical protein